MKCDHGRGAGLKSTSIGASANTLPLILNHEMGDQKWKSAKDGTENRVEVIWRVMNS
jgi:hypothetical protein